MKSFLLGLGLGAGLTTLVAPQSGKRSRQELARFGRHLADRLSLLSSNFGFQPSLRDRKRESESATNRDTARPRRGSDDDLISKLNDASKEELMSVNGIGEVTADRIIRHRPYHSADQLIEENVVPRTTVERIRQQLLDGEAA